MSRGSDLTESHVWALGALQCVLWGCLYYSFPLLLPRMAADLGVGKVAISGAFSLGLLAAAGAAPWVGRLLDRGTAASVLRIGGWIAVVALALWSRVESVLGLCAIWVLLGAAMAAVLYESTFSWVIRATPVARARAHRLTIVTLLGGLASVVFAPWVSRMAEEGGWRVAVAAITLAAAAAMAAVDLAVLRGRQATPMPVLALDDGILSDEPVPKGVIAAVMVAGAVGSFASVAVATHLVPMLLERNASARQAAFGLALLGLAQLPGRFFLRSFAHRLSVRAWLLVPGALQILGLAGLAISLPRLWALLAIAGFGLGSGLQTLARPFLALRTFGIAGAGRGSGAMVSAQSLSRAAAPVVVATGAVRLGYGTVFAAIALAWAAVGVVGFVSGSRRAAR